MDQNSTFFQGLGRTRNVGGEVIRVNCETSPQSNLPWSCTGNQGRHRDGVRPKGIWLLGLVGGEGHLREGSYHAILVLEVLHDLGVNLEHLTILHKRNQTLSPRRISGVALGFKEMKK